MKIIFLGDSLTQGAYGGDFVAEFAALRPDDTVVNSGVGGNTILDIEARLDDVIGQSPDAVFVMVGGNDAISYTQPETRPYYKAQGVPDGIVTPELFAATYRDILSHLQLAFVPVWMGLPPCEYNPELIAAQKQFNALAAEVAASFSIPALDLLAHFEPESPPERPPIGMEMIRLIGKRTESGWDDYEADRQKYGYTYSFDGLHITPDTAREIGRLIHEFMAS